jgi:SpoVK/Ycf46/Vps4 family AAA+-type ATPase
LLRGGRFTEKIEVGVPDDQGYLRLIDKHLGSIPLAASLTSRDIVGRLRGISPADLQALVNMAERMARRPCRRSFGMTSSRLSSGTKSTFEMDNSNSSGQVRRPAYRSAVT